MSKGYRISITHLLKATGIAGAETHLLALLPALREQGVNSNVILLEDPRRPQSEFRGRLEQGGATVVSLPIYWHADLSLPARLISAMRAQPFDILHAHLPHGEVYGEIALRAFPAKFFVISRHNDDRFRRWRPLRLAFAPSLSRANAIIAISAAVERFIIDVEHASAEKVIRIPYGLDARAYADQAVTGRFREDLGVGSHPLILFVGRLTHQKGADILLRAFAQVEKRIPEASLALAGDGPLRTSLEQLAQAQGIRNVHFLGWRTDVPNLIEDCNILAMPSRWEGFGLTALEAMALAKPVIAARVSALPEIIMDEKTGILIPPDDPGRLADAIIRLIVEENLAKAYGQAGQTRVLHEFTLNRMAEQTVEAYRRIFRA